MVNKSKKKKKNSSSELDELTVREIELELADYIFPSKKIQVLDDLLINGQINEYDEALHVRVNLAIESLVQELNHIDSLFSGLPNKAIITLSGMYMLPERLSTVIDRMKFPKLLEERLNLQWSKLQQTIKKQKLNINTQKGKIIWKEDSFQLTELFVLLKMTNLVADTGKDGNNSWIEVTENFLKQKIKSLPFKKLTSNTITREFDKIRDRITYDEFEPNWSYQDKTLLDYKNELKKE